MDLPMPVVCLGHRYHVCLSPLSFRAPGAPKPTVSQFWGPSTPWWDGWGWAGIVTAALGFALGFTLACMAVLCGSKEEEEFPFMGGRKRSHL